MTAQQRLAATRRAVVAGTLVRGLFVAAATGLALLAAAAVVDLLVPLGRELRAALRGAGILAALIGWVLTLRPLRSGTTLTRVALWVEAQFPELRYELVTLAGRADGSPSAVDHHATLEQRVAGVQWEAQSRRALARGLLVPALVAASAAALLVAIPEATLARVTRPAVGDAATRRGITPESRSAVAVLSATVTPPAYTGTPRQSLDEPTLVTATVGSRLELRGRGDAQRVSATIDGRRLSVAGDDGRWTVSLAVSGPPFAIRLRDSTAADERIVAVEPQADAAPRVTLESPARDTVLRTPTGRIALRATALDDFGVASLRFEWIVSAGEGENFTFRSGSVAIAGGRARSREGAASLSIDSLQLTPGSMVHVRAVARDGNTVSGAGEGVSETRMLRIARASEYDSLAIEAGAPPEADKSALSQRMLIMQTEALEKRRPRLDRRTLVREATAIALDQARLRKRVGELVFQRLTGEDAGEHSHEDLSPEELLAHAAAESGVAPSPEGHGDEAPIVAINAPLLEAYNAMWEAQTSLALAELKEALPAMYRALDAIQRARAAERVYLRGRPAVVVIDLAKVRLVGDRPPRAADRSARPAPTARLALAARFERALTLAARDPSAAADSLTMLRLAVVGNDATSRPALAAALASAASALRGSDSGAAESALRAARRAMSGEPRSTPGLATWGAGL